MLAYGSDASQYFTRETRKKQEKGKLINSWVKKCESEHGPECEWSHESRTDAS